MERLYPKRDMNVSSSQDGAATGIGGTASLKEIRISRSNKPTSSNLCTVTMSVTMKHKQVTYGEQIFINMLQRKGFHIWEQPVLPMKSV